MSGQAANIIDPGAENDESGLHIGHLGFLFIAFAILYSATAVYFDRNVQTLTREISASERFGPIISQKSNTVILVSVENLSLFQYWGFTEIRVLDRDGKTISILGGLAYHQTGMDAGTRWVEEKRLHDAKVVLPRRGEYFLAFKVVGGPLFDKEGKDTTDATRLKVMVEQKYGSSLAFNVFGLIALLVGGTMSESRNRTTARTLSRSIEALKNFGVRPAVKGTLVTIGWILLFAFYIWLEIWW